MREYTARIIMGSQGPQKGRAGRVAVLAFFCAWVNFLAGSRVNTIGCKCMMNGGTMTATACMFILARIFGSFNLKLSTRSPDRMNARISPLCFYFHFKVQEKVGVKFL